MPPDLVVLDIFLVAGLIGIAWQVLVSPDMFKAVVLYLALGLLMALTWARLSAPDIALAEAAIGAGLTGALLLDAAGQMRGGAYRTSGRNARSIADGSEDGPASHGRDIRSRQ